MFTKHNVPCPFTVNGRITLANGPTSRTISCVFVSVTRSHGDRSPARYACAPSSPTIVLCDPDSTEIVLMISPVAPSTTCQ